MFERFTNFADGFDLRPARRIPGLGWQYQIHYCHGGGESSSASTETETNQQTTVQGGAAGSTQNTIGAGANYTGAGGMTLGTSAGNINITQQDVDSGLIQTIAGNGQAVLTAALTANGNVTENADILANNATANALALGAETTGNALASNNAVTANADTLASNAVLGAETSAEASAAVANDAIISANNSQNSALGFGSEVVSSSLDFATKVSNNAAANNAESLTFAGNALNAALTANTSLATNTVNTVAVTSAAATEQAQSEEGAIAADFAQIVANNTAQTTAAESENLSGSSAIQPVVVASADKSSTWEAYAVIGGVLLSLFVFFKSKGKAA